MPGIMVTIGGDSRDFRDQLGQVSVVAKRVGSATVQELERMRAGLQNQMATVDRATAKWENYAQSLRNVESRLQAAKAQMDIGGRQSGRSTVTAQNEQLTADQKYVEDFKRLLAEKERAETDSSVRAATRSNAARRLLRQRAADAERRDSLTAQEKLDAEVEQASRNNLARRLRREREMKRQAAAQEAFDASFRGQISNFFRSSLGRFTALGVIGGTIGAAIKDAIRVDMVYQRIGNTLRAASGNARQAAQDFQFLREVATSTGVTVEDLGEDYARFTVAARTAGLTVRQTNQIFRAFAQTGASLGLDAGRQKQMLLAVTQMISKQTLSMEELKRQLSEAMPMAFDVFSKAMGVTIPEMIKMIESGEVLAADVLPKVAAVLESNPNFKFVVQSQKEIGRLKQELLDLKAAAGSVLRGPTGFVAGWTANILTVYRTLAQSLSKRLFGGLDADREAAEIIYGIAKPTSEVGMKWKDKPDEQPLPDYRWTEANQKALDKLEETKRASDAEQEKRDNAKLSLEERRAKLLERIRSLQRDVGTAIPFEGLTEQDKADRMLKLQKTQTELTEVERDIAREKEQRKGRRPDFGVAANEQQSRGAYIGGPSIALLDVNKTMSRTLFEIRDRLSKQNPPGGTAGGAFYGN